MLLKRRTQITDSHCGPAVIEMLLDNLGITIGQTEITKAAGAVKTIEALGTSVDQLALAVQKLAPEVILYYKTHAAIADIDLLLSKYNLPVGVNWQGMFYENEEEEEQERLVNGDYGHYSVVTRVDKERKSLIIVDPYKEFTTSDRIIENYKFVNRWWDIDPRTDPLTGKKKYNRYDRLLFVISSKNPKMVGELDLKSFFS